ncbi:MAG: Ig-like domain-containing protein, partial [Chlamydiota bacterium]|nr:Ig-like domain-containing protein [Chlamydiota bacterium]
MKRTDDPKSEDDGIDEELKKIPNDYEESELADFSFVTLEERIVLDAALVADIVDAVTPEPPVVESTGDVLNSDGTDAAEPESYQQIIDPSVDDDSEVSPVDAPNAAEKVHLLIISTDVNDHQQLADSAADNILIITFNPDSTSLQDLSNQISETLDGRLADTIALASHGENGAFQLTDGIEVSSSSLSQNENLTAFWQEIGSNIKDGGRFDLLGCNIGTDDQGLLEKIDNLMDVSDKNIDLAASDDVTGNVEYGGDWDLEVGNVDALMYFDLDEIYLWDETLGDATNSPGNVGHWEYDDSFDGYNDYVEIPHDSDMLLDEGTIELVVNPDDLNGTEVIFSKDSSGYDDGGQVTIYRSGGRIYAWIESSWYRNYVYGGSISAGEDSHIALTFGNSGMRLYVNGVYVDYNSYRGGLTGNENPIVIGAYAGNSGNNYTSNLSNFFDGKISVVNIHDKALDSDTIADRSGVVHNHTPVVKKAIPDVTANEDAVNKVIDLSKAFKDSDSGDTLVYTVVGNTNSSLVSTSISSGNLTLDYGDNQNGSSTITVRATDSFGAYVEDTFVVTVNPVNDAPTVANAIADITVSEDSANTVLDLSHAFEDVDILTNNDNLTFTVVSNTNSSLVGASLSGNSLTLDYADNQNGVATIKVRATDSTGAYVEDTFTVTVNAVNDAPIVNNAIADVTVNEDAANTVLNLSQAFTDVDILTNSDNLTLTVVGNTNTSLVGASLLGSNLTLDYADNQNGVANITIRATDSTGAFVEDTFTVTLNAVNYAPTLDNAIADVTVNEDAANTILDLSQAFADVDILTNSDNLTLEVISNTNTGLVGASLSGNSLTLDYADNQNGVANITIRATDSTGAYVEDTFTVTVNAVNDAPTVDNAIADVTVSEDAANTVLDLSQAFADVDILTNSDELTLEVVTNTNTGLVGASLSGNTLTLDYADNQNGVANITIRATDSTGAYVEDTFTVTVNAV